MNERITQILLAAAILLLVANLMRPTWSTAQAQTKQTPAVLRAQAIELVNKEGKTVAQLHVGEDGGGNLRLRSGNGIVRVKLGATDDGSGLLLLDKDVEPAVSLTSNRSGTSIVLEEKGRNKRIIEP